MIAARLKSHARSMNQLKKLFKFMKASYNYIYYLFRKQRVLLNFNILSRKNLRVL